MGIINYKCVTTFENAMTMSLFTIIDLCTHETQNENFLHRFWVDVLHETHVILKKFNTVISFHSHIACLNCKFLHNLHNKWFNVYIYTSTVITI